MTAAYLYALPAVSLAAAIIAAIATLHARREVRELAAALLECARRERALAGLELEVIMEWLEDGIPVQAPLYRGRIEQAAAAATLAGRNDLPRLTPGPGVTVGVYLDSRRLV